MPALVSLHNPRILVAFVVLEHISPCLAVLPSSATPQCASNVNILVGISAQLIGPFSEYSSHGPGTLGAGTCDWAVGSVEVLVGPTVGNKTQVHWPIILYAPFCEHGWWASDITVVIGDLLGFGDSKDVIFLES
ncbi:hypothetical protein HG531_009091 [Fusarium graminearum]|nr:hypothetical protein HG531_009091 [Fusarium graminearum]